MDHLVQQRLTQCLRVLLEVLERELDQRRLVRDAPGEVRETRIVRDPVRGNLAAEALVVELREEELELGDVGQHAFEALYAPARTSLLVTRGAGSGLPPRIYLPKMRCSKAACAHEAALEGQRDRTAGLEGSSRPS